MMADDYKIAKQMDTSFFPTVTAPIKFTESSMLCFLTLTTSLTKEEKKLILRHRLAVLVLLPLAEPLEFFLLYLIYQHYVFSATLL